MHHTHQDHILSLAKKDKERRELYLATFLRALAISLIGVFIPAYLLSVGASLQLIFVYFAVGYTSYVFVAPLALNLANKFGLKKIMLAGVVAHIGFLALFFAIKRYPILIIPTAIYAGIPVMFFWAPWHILFAKNTHRASVAEETSYVYLASRLASVIGPLAGGFLIIKLGFDPLFVIVAVVMLASAAPLFLTKDYQITLKHNWKNVLTSDKSNYIKWFFFDGISAIVPVLFHFYVYLQTNSFATTGAVAATMGVGMAITSVVVGKLSDRIGKHKILRLAALLTGATWLAAIFFAQPLALYALSLFIGLFGMSLGMNVAGIFFNKVRGKKDTGELMIVRETSLGIGRVLVFAVAIALAILAPAYIFKVIFGLAALASAWFFIGNL